MLVSATVPRLLLDVSFPVERSLAVLVDGELVEAVLVDVELVDGAPPDSTSDSDRESLLVGASEKHALASAVARRTV